MVYYAVYLVKKLADKEGLFQMIFRRGGTLLKRVPPLPILLKPDIKIDGFILIMRY